MIKLVKQKVYDVYKYNYMLEGLHQKLKVTNILLWWGFDKFGHTYQNHLLCQSETPLESLYMY